MKPNLPARALTEALLQRWPLPRARGGKEERGRVLLIGGSRTIPGAVLLSASAALRAGAGKLQCATSRSVAPMLAMALPEAKVVGLSEDRAGELAVIDAGTRDEASKANAVLIGPGMSESSGRRIVQSLLRSVTAPVVLDAGALSAATGRNLRQAVLTPHHGEMSSITGLSVQRVAAQPERVAREFAAAHRAVVVLKGAETWIASPDGRCWRYTGGSPGLGTSGSGDVLAGILVGLLARGAFLEQAAVWAVWLHGEAGRRLSRRIGPLGFIARELPSEIPPLMAHRSSSASRSRR